MKETIIPVISPMLEDLSLDEKAVKRIFTFLYNNNAIPFILGTTGECASLPQYFKEEYLKVAVENRPYGQKLLVGISSNIIEDSIQFANKAYSLGVETVVATLPSYYSLSEEQMENYFLKLANECHSNLIIYNIPATTHMSIPLDVIERLSHHPKIVAVKDSERSLDRLIALLEICKNREDFKHYMGWAGQSAIALLNGSSGIVPSTGNFAPNIYTQMCLAAEQGLEDRVYRLQNDSDKLGNIYQFNKSLGDSLWALKVLMKQFDLCDTYMMPPLNKDNTEEEIELISNFQDLITNNKLQFNSTSNE
ncbi:dihydrodipicolinate synthase family protein [Sphingobacterium bovistauri]|uniref:Dihydrodipicolinate synthase family protein n=1 Tax=Sphingobacterium bovistauri TaxID=2781959 RepID=A0ABS7Z572_9SPHI|nr:dihydrodipicolinate synthase family protein [Sphingobacterium bovistauri]MCA5004712.1 dihydrodipicolinate synthase family protein [Sphingobacterium bovistauri]